MISVAISAPTPYSASTPPPPNSPTPIPACLPFSVSSALASAISSRTSRVICSLARCTNSEVDWSATGRAGPPFRTSAMVSSFPCDRCMPLPRVVNPGGRNNRTLMVRGRAEAGSSGPDEGGAAGVAVGRRRRTPGRRRRRSRRRSSAASGGTGAAGRCPPATAAAPPARCSQTQPTSRSRTRQRRSHNAPASRALTRARSRIIPPIASVTCSTQTRPSHSSEPSQTVRSSARSSSTGADQSTSTSAVPSTADPVRVQFWNGLVVKYEVGRISRRSSQICTAT